jgi:O-antigen ligase
LIQKNWLTGFGTGIGRIELNKTYVSKGYISLKKKNTNTHNQYLQYLLDHGIIGFLFLFFLTIIMLIISLKERDYVYTIFIFLLIINFMTESILETQSGIVFFALFNTIFFFHWINKKAIAN